MEQESNVQKNANGGFNTVVVVIIVVLVIGCVVGLFALGATFFVMNPSKTFADARNAQRSSDTKILLSAVTQYSTEMGNSLDDLGEIPLCSSGEQAEIGSSAGNIDLGLYLVDEYIIDIPFDPVNGSAENTGYTICKTEEGRVEISAPNAENGETISTKR